jgi:DNA-3-methyladenine glycosylase
VNRRYGTPRPDDANPINQPNLQAIGLTNGPGKLAQALGISVAEYDGADLCAGSLVICHDISIDESRVGISPRIGLAEGKGDKEPWRWFVADSPYVSRRRSAHSRNAEWMRHESSP